jgi:hypothetical protein
VSEEVVLEGKRFLVVVEWFCESTLVGAMAFEFGVVFVLVLLSCFNVNSVESDDGECCSFTLPRLFFLLFLLEWREHNNIQSLKLCQQVVIFMVVIVTKLNTPCAFFFVF